MALAIMEYTCSKQIGFRGKKNQNAMFFVIEGLDGSGKSTQLKLLRSFFEKENLKYQDIHFPKLDEGYFGKLVAEFLQGEFGGLDEVHPKLVALLFACDRKEHVHLLENWLEEGNVLIADRFVNSNIAFQCAKCEDPKKKKDLKNWILDFEFNFNQLPKPTCSLFLDVPFKAVEKSLSNSRKGDDRAYLDGKEDIHESSLDFQEMVRQEYLTMVEEQEDFHLVKCYDEAGNFLSPELIHQKIKAKLGFE